MRSSCSSPPKKSYDWTNQRRTWRKLGNGTCHDAPKWPTQNQLDVQVEILVVLVLCLADESSQDRDLVRSENSRDVVHVF